MRREHHQWTLLEIADRVNSGILCIQFCMIQTVNFQHLYERKTFRHRFLTVTFQSGCILRHRLWGILYLGLRCFDVISKLESWTVKDCTPTSPLRFGGWGNDRGIKDNIHIFEFVLLTEWVGISRVRNLYSVYHIQEWLCVCLCDRESVPSSTRCFVASKG